jgi:hypothetical protein
MKVQKKMPGKCSKHFQALTGSIYQGQNRYEQFNGNPACVQRWPHGGTR